MNTNEAFISDQYNTAVWINTFTNAEFIINYSAKYSKNNSCRPTL